jgi:DNA repair exonuclease SbcCD ATPase subunit
MTDIIELRDCLEYREDALSILTNEAANEIESLRQKLEDSVHAYDVCQQECERMKQQLAESQALVKVLRDALEAALEVGSHLMSASSHEAARRALAMPSDSTALDGFIKQAKSEALLEAAAYFTPIDAGAISTITDRRAADELRRMAEEME